MKDQSWQTKTVHTGDSTFFHSLPWGCFVCAFSNFFAELADLALHKLANCCMATPLLSAHGSQEPWSFWKTNRFVILGFGKENWQMCALQQQSGCQKLVYRDSSPVWWNFSTGMWLGDICQPLQSIWWECIHSLQLALSNWPCLSQNTPPLPHNPCSRSWLPLS